MVASVERNAPGADRSFSSWCGEIQPLTIKDLKLDILKQEIDLINAKINHFDDLRHRTKQMAMTLWLAAVGVSLSTKLDILLWLAAFVPLPFWYLETVYHAYQEGFVLRWSAIRRFIRDGKHECADGTIAQLVDCMNDDHFGSFPVPDDYGRRSVEKTRHDRATSVLRNLVKTRPMLFYLLLVGAAIVLARFAPA